MRGAFITFEGPEGGGKSSQVLHLAQRLRALGLDVVQTREPGGTPAGEAIRNILQHDSAGESLCHEAELLLFSASRAQLVRTVIEPALQRGAWVLCDRFVDSTTAYQGFGRELGVEPLQPIHDMAIGSTLPDLTLVLDLDVSQGMARVHRRAELNGGKCDRIESEPAEFHERVRQGYLTLASMFPDRYRIIAADDTEDAVECNVWVAVHDKLAQRLPQGDQSAGQ